MKINIDYIKPIMKYRFSYFGMLLEYSILDYLGHLFYKGDRVTWEAHRRAGYKMYGRGCTLQEIASRHRVPAFIVEWWISVWETYDAMWSPVKYN